MDDNRQLQRFAISVPACIETDSQYSSTGGREFFSRDISSGGAFFFTSDPLAVGTSVRVELLLWRQGSAQADPKRALVRINGKVLRADRTGMAVRFDRHFKISSVETWIAQQEQPKLRIVAENAS